jgi:arylformamidase
MAKGASVNVSAITMSPHIGTHADAPVHVRSGTAGADELPLDAFYGPAVVVDVSDLEGEITLDVLDTRMAGAPAVRILLKTGRTIGAGTFPDRWPALSPDCATTLVARGLRLLGVDCPSVDDRESKTLAVHHALFDGGACVVENLDLHAVTSGSYQLASFPVKFAGLDGAPVRAVLIE